MEWIKKKPHKAKKIKENKVKERLSPRDVLYLHSVQRGNTSWNKVEVYLPGFHSYLIPSHLTLAQNEGLGVCLDIFFFHFSSFKLLPWLGLIHSCKWSNQKRRNEHFWQLILQLSNSSFTSAALFQPPRPLTSPAHLLFKTWTENNVHTMEVTILQ